MQKHKRDHCSINRTSAETPRGLCYQSFATTQTSQIAFSIQIPQLKIKQMKKYMNRKQVA